MVQPLRLQPLHDDMAAVGVEEVTDFHTGLPEAFEEGSTALTHGRSAVHLEHARTGVDQLEIGGSLRGCYLVTTEDLPATARGETATVLTEALQGLTG